MQCKFFKDFVYKSYAENVAERKHGYLNMFKQGFYLPTAARDGRFITEEYRDRAPFCRCFLNLYRKHALIMF